MSVSPDSINMPGQPRGKSRALWVLFVLLIAGAGGGWWYTNNTANQAEAEKPLLVKVEVGSIENTVASAGTLKPSRFVDVGAQVSGMLQKLHVEVGDVVETGQLLAEIDARVQEARVEASRASIQAQVAQLDARRAALVLARANAQRQERLMGESATSQLEYDNAINNLASAEASLVQLEKQIEQSNASLAQEETLLEFTKIYAPTSGTIVSIEMNEGRTLNANQMAPNILRIADLTTMTVEADISEADISSIRKGMDVYFTTLGGGNRRWYSKVRQVLPTPEVLNFVVMYTGLFDIENTDGALLSEMTAQVYFISSAANDVLTVPMGALTFVQAPSQEQIAARMAARPDSGAEGSPSGFAPPAGFTPPAGGFGGAGARGGAGRGAAAVGRPRPATVNVMLADGTQEQRQVMIGVTSRVSAEVLSGLKEGEEVVAGIIQAAPTDAVAPQNQRNFRPGGGFGGF